MTNENQRKAANAVFSYLENLEQVLEADQILSDPLFLRVNRREIGVYRQPIEIDKKQYQIVDPSSYRKWNHVFNKANVVIFVVSLTSYCEFSDGDTEMVRRTLALLDKGRKTEL